MQQPAESPTITIPAEVNRTLIPVVVRDKSGHVVEGLKQQDFQVLDNGKPRKIVGFLTEQSQAAEEAAHPPTGNATAPQQTAQTAQAAAPGYIVLVLDNMHAGPEYLDWAKQAAEKLLAGPMLDTNFAAVFSLSGSVHTALTRDRDTLEQALKSIRPVTVRRAEFNCPRMDYYEAHQYEANDRAVVEEINSEIVCVGPHSENELGPGAEAAAHMVELVGRMDVDNALGRIEQIANAMAHLQGRRLLVLASSGFFTGASQDIDKKSQLIDAANAAGVTISALNTHGLSSVDPADSPGENVPNSPQVAMAEKISDEEVMRELAFGTGGTFFHNSNDIGGEFERLIETPDCIYVLELSLDEVEKDGSYHSLQVKVDRDRMQVQARRGYTAPDKKRKPIKAN
jgi:VWFA-related protein